MLFILSILLELERCSVHPRLQRARCMKDFEMNKFLRLTIIYS
jgi:hypothetical protein